MKILTSVFLIVGVIASGACGPSARQSEGDGDGGVIGGMCTAGVTNCDGNEMLTCVNGVFVAGQQCPGVCDVSLGCVLCHPGTGTCMGDVSNACNDDGMGYTNVTCDAEQGVTCGSSGTCEGACSPVSLGSSYIGCEYYPTVTGNLVSNDFDFAVAISNTGTTPANVTIEDGALSSTTMLTVAPNTVELQKLPWQQDLKFCNETDETTCGACDGTEDSSCAGSAAQVTKGAYHLRSDSPVTVYQFNSLEYTLPSGEFSYTNDASLMLPTNVWKNQYYVAAYTGEFWGDELAVTAWQDNTHVTINSKAATPAGGGAPAFAVGTAQTVTLNAGDVIELLTPSTGDLTGSYVTSDNPIQVIGGHVCADMPDENTCCCDHMEESMFSVDALGQNYMINAPTVTSSLTANIQVIRIIATTANTNLTYDPPQTGAPATIANAGDFVTISESSASFLIHADQKVLVAQYMNGQGSGPAGDPAMTLAVPVEQWRSSYLFHAPVSYTSNYIDVSAPDGAQITLDGTPMTFDEVGTSTYAIGRRTLTLGPNNDGSHTITGNMPFGIQVYGYGQYTSYWYPGGLNLTSVIVAAKH